ncbi:MAG: DNA gyrase subunit A [Betaproteobacteria bacterium]|nr:DNA gyrase subunit A [Betaproteobacteria bacterium]MDH5222113.1 DNA gyrase subunit A [Betaproteobacteria bacterium]MDH5351623.1 DNA gyrase subunit A [Betaproteobacteria bacterium]
MEPFAKETLPVSLEEEMRRSYLDYAMSVIVGRALPDVRDGLKPVHRRVLFAMQEANNVWNRPYVKCARVVGEVLGKYHPHGDSATYEALVRMAQDFSMRYMLVDGQGNFGSIDGDNAAAYRYTECRLAKLSSEMLADIDKETVDFVPNYDGKELEPAVLPTRVPNLLVNGSSGIAVGMATNVPPHNLGEVVDACLHLLAHPGCPIEDLMKLVPAPDFPTAGIIYGLAGVHEGYRTGRGRVVMRARTHFEDMEKGNRQCIVVDELPYQVNKKALLERIAELVTEKKLEGVSDIRDESDKDGIRVVIELKRGELPEVVLNNLYKQTQLQDSFGMNMVALVDGQPKLLNLQQLLQHFLSHRREVVTRRTVFDLRKARERGHVLEGLAVALSNVDEVIALIKAAPSPADAKRELMARAWASPLVREMLGRASAEAYRPEGLAPEFGLKEDGYRLSDAQAQAILELRLQRLTGLEQDKIRDEYKEVMALIADLLDLLDKPARITALIDAELRSLKEAFADARRTEIVTVAEDISIEDLIAPQDMVVTFSHGGYVKSQPLADYRAQRRGGRGRAATAMKEDDFIERLFVAHSHDYLLCFSDRGRLYWLKVFEVPQGSRASRGKPIVNVFPLEEGEKITAVVPVKEFDEQHFVLMATARGTVKKTPLAEFSRPRPSGIIAVTLEEGDYLVGGVLTDGSADVMLFSSEGKAVRFAESEVRPMGRQAGGVRGMRLPEDGGHRIVCMLVAKDESRTVLTATGNGYGKRTPISEYTKHGRGGQGLIAIQATERNGPLVGAVLVEDSDQVMLISTGGVLIRMAVAQIREQGRSTQGVTLINLGEGEKLAGMERIEEKDEEAGGNGNGHGEDEDPGAGGEGEPPLPEGDSPAPTVH